MTARTTTADKRSPRDAYWTPAHLTHALIDGVPEIAGARVWEPCAGAGWMVDVLRERGCEVRASDIHPMRGDIERRDFLRGRVQAWEGWIVTNPPFNLAAQVLARALAMTPKVALLTRASFLEGTTARRPLFREHPPSRQIIVPRCEYPRGDGQAQSGTDSVHSQWVIWGVACAPVKWRGYGDDEQLRLV